MNLQKPHKVEAGRAQKLIFEISEDAHLGEYFYGLELKVICLNYFPFG